MEKPDCLTDYEWDAVRVMIAFHADNADEPHRAIVVDALRKLVAAANAGRGEN